MQTLIFILIKTLDKLVRIFYSVYIHKRIPNLDNKSSGKVVLLRLYRKLAFDESKVVKTK